MAVQVVLITGCSKGIGQGIALHLAKDPQRRYKVYATMRNLNSGQSDIKEKAESLLDTTLFLKELDVTKQATIDKTVKEITEKEGKIDVLVNNAGIADGSWWENEPIDEYSRVMDTNYLGCVRTTQAVVPFMKEKRYGRVIQISSVVGFKPWPHMIVAYTASKFALEGFSEAISPSLRKFNVWVSVLQLGNVMTPMSEEFGGDLETTYNLAIEAIPGEMREVVRDIVSKNPHQLLMETQSVEDIGKIVEDTIVSDKPDYRIQTSGDAKRWAKERFVDPTGNATMAEWIGN